MDTSLEYGAAKMWCQGLGAQLVEFWTEQEYQDVSAYFSNFYQKPSLSHKSADGYYKKFCVYIVEVTMLAYFEMIRLK